MTRGKDHARAVLTKRKRAAETFPAFLERTTGAPVPVHQREAAEALDAYRDGGGRVVIDFFPGGGKSTIAKSYAAWRLGRRPELRVGYFSYSARLATHHSRDLRAIATSHAGVALDGAAKGAGLWRTEAGGYVLASSVAGAGSGFRLDLAIVDDSFASRLDYESPQLRERVHDWYRAVVRTRIEPDGTILAPCTRWGDHDLSAAMIAAGFTHLSAPAVRTVDGVEVSAWPDRYDLEELHEVRDEIGARDWASLYLAQPLGSDETPFRDLFTFDSSEPFSGDVVIGIDCAYSAKTSADASVAVVLGRPHLADRVHVLDVVAVQSSIAEFAATLAALRDKWHARQIVWHASSMEALAVSTVFRDRGVYVRTLPARADKVSRAWPTAARWRDGKIRVPSDESLPWRQPLLRELYAFPGGRRDDRVDALVSASEAFHFAPTVGDFSRLTLPEAPRPRTVGGMVIPGRDPGFFGGRSAAPTSTWGSEGRLGRGYGR